MRLLPPGGRVRLGLSVLVAVATLGGCGSRLSGAEIVADSGGGEVTISLPPDVLQQLQQAAARNVPAPAAGSGAVTGPKRAATTALAPAGAAADVSTTRARTAGAAAADNVSPAAVPSIGKATWGAGGPPACTSASAPVPIGQVGTFSGVVGAITAGARAATAVWAKDVNSRGGLGCHPVQLFTEDDAGDPSRSAAAVKDLVDRQHVIALVSNQITFSVAGFVPAVAAAKVPAVGGDTIAQEWFTSPWMFPQGDSIDDQARAIIEAGVAAGHKKLGYLYCVEVPACGYLDKKFFHEGYAKAAGADPVYDSPVSITQPDYTAQCLNARNAGVDLLGLGMDGAAQTRVARSCASIGYRPLLATGAATFTLRNTEDPNLRAFGLVSGSSVAPWMAEDTPAAKLFHETLARLAPELVPDGEAMLGWTSGKLLEAVVDRLTPAERSGPLTTALILTGLGRIKGETLGGLTGPITFGPGEAHATSSGCNYFERLGPNGWSTPTGSKPVCH